MNLYSLHSVYSLVPDIQKTQQKMSLIHRKSSNSTPKTKTLQYMYMDQLVANCGHVLHQLRVSEEYGTRTSIYLSGWYFLCNSKMEWIYTIQQLYKHF